MKTDSALRLLAWYLPLVGWLVGLVALAAWVAVPVDAFEPLFGFEPDVGQRLPPLGYGLTVVGAYVVMVAALGATPWRLAWRALAGAGVAAAFGLSLLVWALGAVGGSGAGPEPFVFTPPRLAFRAWVNATRGVRLGFFRHALMASTPKARFRAYSAFLSEAAAGQPFDEELVVSLVRALVVEDSEEGRGEVAAALREVPLPAAARDVLLPALHHPNVTVRRAAVDLLPNASLTPAAHDLLVELAKGDPDATVRRRAIEVDHAAFPDKPELEALLLERLAAGDPAAVDGLLTLDSFDRTYSERLHERLRQVLQTGTPEDQEAWLGALLNHPTLGGLPASALGDLPPLIALLEDAPNASLASTATSTLNAWQPEGGRPPPEAAARRWLHRTVPKFPEARLAFLRDGARHVMAVHGGSALANELTRKWFAVVDDEPSGDEPLRSLTMGWYVPSLALDDALVATLTRWLEAPSAERRTFAAWVLAAGARARGLDSATLTRIRSISGDAKWYPLERAVSEAPQ